MSKTIWCVFEIANEYNQPDNDLFAAFTTKPDYEELAQVVGDTIALELVTGKESQCQNTYSYFRLEEFKLRN